MRKLIGSSKSGKSWIGRIASGMAAVTVVSSLLCTGASAGVPYDSYTYDFWGNYKQGPLPYEFSKTLSGLELGIDTFGSLTDVIAYEDKVYLLDGGKNQIIILNSEFEYEKTIYSFINTDKDDQEDTFYSPQGMYIKDGIIYVADTQYDPAVAPTIHKPGEPDAEGEGDEPAEGSEDGEETPDEPAEEGTENADNTGDETAAVEDTTADTGDQTTGDDTAQPDADGETGEDSESEEPDEPLTEEEKAAIKTRGRIVKLTIDGEYVESFGRPDTSLLNEDFPYQPTRIVTDKSGRMYVIAKGVTDGLIELDPDGGFIGFYGANEVSFNFFDYIWRFFMSEEQLANRVRFLPTEFSNIDVDEDGFVFATVSSAEMGSVEPVKRLNPKGTDVLRRNGYVPPWGDYTGSIINSKFMDVTVHSSGIYSVLDQSCSRVFTYDPDGNLLYAFGDKGSTQGNIEQAACIEYVGDDLIIIDSLRNTANVYKQTEYGQYIQQAEIAHINGDYDVAAEAWSEVRRLNSNSDLAYIGIGRVELREGNYEEAVELFELAQSRNYYSKAYKYHRKESMTDMVPIIGGCLIALVAIGLFVSWRKPVMNYIRKVSKDDEIS